MAPLTGVHRVRKTLANGWSAEYWYAWRGGPGILACKAQNPKALAREIAKAAPAAAAQLHKLTQPQSKEGLLSGLIYAFQESPEFGLLAPRTRKDLKKHLGVVSDGLGTLPQKALASPQVRQDIMEWRDQYAATPCTADQYIAALASALKWARDDRGLITSDPLARWKRLYRVDRASIVWEPDEVAALCAKASPECSRAARVAVYSGLRQGDLLRLTWAEIGEKAIRTITAKRRRGAVIPITPELRMALDECPKVSPVVLTDPSGKPWKPSTLAKHFSQARAGAKVAGKRWHDFRGTFVTHAARAGFTPTEVAAFVGWSIPAVEQIIAHYVTAEAVAGAAVERMSRLSGS